MKIIRKRVSDVIRKEAKAVIRKEVKEVERMTMVLFFYGAVLLRVLK